MSSLLPRIRGRLDRLGLLLSCLCVVHCIAGLVLVVGLGLGSTFLMHPDIHKYGLLVATLVAGIAIGMGAFRHRRRTPFVIAMMGLSFMGGALAVGHGAEEVVLTIIGVTLVAAGHILNMRAA